MKTNGFSKPVAILSPKQCFEQRPGFATDSMCPLLEPEIIPRKEGEKVNSARLAFDGRTLAPEELAIHSAEIWRKAKGTFDAMRGRAPSTLEERGAVMIFNQKGKERHYSVVQRADIISNELIISCSETPASYAFAAQANEFEAVKGMQMLRLRAEIIVCSIGRLFLRREPRAVQRFGIPFSGDLYPESTEDAIRNQVSRIIFHGAGGQITNGRVTADMHYLGLVANSQMRSIDAVFLLDMSVREARESLPKKEFQWINLSWADLECWLAKGMLKLTGELTTALALLGAHFFGQSFIESVKKGKKEKILELSGQIVGERPEGA